MEARELRIGNWVYKIENGEKVLYDVSSGERIDYIDALSGSTEYLEFEPIPLTEEWLKRAGFDMEKFKALNIIHGTMYAYPRFESPDFDISLSVGLYVEDSEILPHVQSVHQLQNLYFALTGDELEFKTVE